MISAVQIAGKINRLVLAAVFFGILLIPSVLFDRPAFAPASLQENRQMEPFPRLKLFWLQGVEHWFSDRFGMRARLVYTGARLQMNLLGVSTNRKVVLGRDGWLFLDENFKAGSPVLADFSGRSPFSDEQLERITRNLQQAQRVLKVCGIPFYLVMAPDKQGIYPEKVPIQRNGSPVTRADQLFAHLRAKAPEVQAIDLRLPLRAAKLAQAHELYMRTDTHWNALGAYYGYRDIALRLASDGLIPRSPRTIPANYSAETVPFAGGDLAVSALFLPGYFEDYVVRLGSSLPVNARPLGGPPPWAGKSDSQDFQAYENPAARTRLLIYRDSFFNDVLPFLVEDFGHVQAIFDRNNSRIDGRQVRSFAAQVVMQEVVERHLHWLERDMINARESCPK